MPDNQYLRDLFKEIKVVNDIPADDISISGIRSDSRQISEGDLYLAISGTRVDGHSYIKESVSGGAVAVIGSQPASAYLDLGIPYLQVDDTQQVLAQLAAAWFDYPARKMIIIGVTGTDGKTTTANLIYQILLAADLSAGLISTVNAVIGNKVLDTGFHVTTPEAMDVQYYLSEMVNAGISHVVLEATSHGLAQKRVAACEFDIGAVTNITHEHLDYHGDFDNYLIAKAELFKLIAESSTKPGKYHKVAVLNKDDESYAELRDIVAKLDITEVTYGVNPSADYLAMNINSNADGINFSIADQGDEVKISTSLIGDYNVSNCLAAASVCLAGLDLDWDVVQNGIKDLSGIPGRMESFSMGQDFSAIVDFAHTPNALRRAILAAREFTDRRIIALFGAAGLRDKDKRYLMAEISGELADLTVLTAEDPRTESLDEILSEMAAGVKAKGGVEGKTFWRIRDRGEAIRFALGKAETGDVVLVCGKGHEQSMCFGEIEYPWDDRIALQAGLAEKLDLDGPKMPYLPTQD